MKARKTYRCLFVHPFQYIGLQKYLNHKSEKGWKLKSIFGGNLCLLTFEKAEEKSCYRVDYTNDFSMMEPGTETVKAKKYREFIEEYGYEYIGSNGALQIYQTHGENGAIRENNEDDFKALLKSSLKSYVPYLALLFLIFLIFYSDYQSVKYSLFTDSNAIESILFSIVFSGAGITGLVYVLSWLWRRKPLVSRHSITLLTILLAVTAVYYIYLLLKYNAANAIFVLLLVVVCGYGLHQNTNPSSQSGKVSRYVDIVIEIAFICFIAMDSLTFTPVVNRGEIYKGNRKEIEMIFKEKKKADVEVSMFENKSFLSQKITIEVSEDEENYLQITRYKIQDGLFADWIKSQYEKEGYKELMCPGIREGTKQNGRWVYEGTTSILIVDGYTYLVVDKEFVLDNEGWKNVDRLINM